MSALSDHSENLLLDWLMTNGAATRPTAWYLALFTAAPSDSGGGTELSGNGYSRQAITFGAASAGSTSNSGSITFGPNTTTNWGTVTHVGIFDASSSGNLLWHGALTSSRTINVGDTMTFATSSVSLSLA